MSCTKVGTKEAAPAAGFEDVGASRSSESHPISKASSPSRRRAYETSLWPQKGPCMFLFLVAQTAAAGKGFEELGQCWIELVH